MDVNEEINRVAAHCPNCGAEYRAGFDVCADCGIALEPGPTPAAREDDDEARVPEPDDAWADATRRAWTARKDERDEHPQPAVVAQLPLQEAMLLVGRLEEAGIPARVDADVSLYFVSDLNLLKSVLVPASRLEEAVRVLEDIRAGRDRI